jgi:DNA adenine methylase
MAQLKAPFPWFGGKSRIAPLVWSRTTPPKTFVEPFAGSLAVMLANPHWTACNEIVNDLDGMVTNAWRSIQWDPAATKVWADWPVSELDLHARSTYSESQRSDLESKLRSDPNYYDPQLAGWWLWGMCIGIGDAYIAQKKSIPNVASSGKGVARKSFDWDHEFEILSNRLRKVKIACGSWERVVRPSVVDVKHPTLVFLDPPYSAADRHTTYAHDSYTVADKVAEWCIQNAYNPGLEIVLAGYEGDYDLGSDWVEVPWKTMGGYSNLAAGQTQGQDNAAKERLWFSPNCPKHDSLNFLNLFKAS